MDAQRNFPILVLSCLRSGSTLMRYILNTHSSVCCPGELNLGDTIFKLNHFIGESLGTTFPPEEKDIVVNNEIGRIINEIMGKYAQREKKILWAEKSPINLNYLRYINQALPNAKYICLYRNCLDVSRSVYSAHLRGAVPGLLQSHLLVYPGDPLSAALASWVQLTTLLVNFEKQNSERCIRIRYEDLVTNPKYQISKIFSFLGINQDANILDRIFNREHVGLGDATVRYSTEIDPTTIGSGAYLSEKPIPEKLKSKINELHSKIGYPPIGEDIRKVFKLPDASLDKTNIESVSSVFTKHIPARIVQYADRLKEFQLKCKFEISGPDGGIWIVDLKDIEKPIKSGDGEADILFKTSGQCLLDIVNDKYSVRSCVMDKLLQILPDSEFTAPRLCGVLLSSNRNSRTKI